MEVIVDLQGFKMPYDVFVMKELASISIQSNKDGMQEIPNVLFKSPCPWSELPNKYKCMNAWLTRNYHGIPWDSGSTTFDRVKIVLDILTKDRSYIYVKGSEKKQWLQNLLGHPKTIIDLNDLECPSARKLPAIMNCCQFYKLHESVREHNCALQNVRKFKKWFLLNHNEVPFLERSLKLYCVLGKILHQ